MTDHFPDATKKVLSPAAQAVLDAYYSTDSLRVAPALVAVLRAAALHLSDTSPWPGHIESTGVNWSSNEFLAIADELEGHA